MNYKRKKNQYILNLMNKISTLKKQNKIKYYLKQIYKERKNKKMIVL